MKKHFLFVLLIGILITIVFNLFSVSSNAAIVGVSGTAVNGGDVSVYASLDNGQIENDNLVIGFDEQQAVWYTEASLQVDWQMGININIGDTIFLVTCSANCPGVLIPSGVYDSHILHFDPASNSGVQSVQEATFTFSGDIVAIISTTDFLIASDDSFGSPTTTYAMELDRRSELNDIFTINANNTLTINNMSIQDFYIDELRVLTLADVTPPTINVSVDNDTLWPPNHKMIPIVPTITTSDNSNCDPIIVELTSIDMNESDAINTYDPSFDLTEDDGNTSDDIQIIDGIIYLRAERLGNSTGRIYTLTYTATDCSGNEATAAATITVPHNQ